MSDDLAKARRLLEYAMQLRMYGERAPGGDETWRQFDQSAEHFLRGLDYPEPGRQEVLKLPVTSQDVIVARDKAEFYHRAAMQQESEIEQTLAPVLGFEAFKPGEPGYSEDQVNYNTGDHVAESLAFAAAAKIEQLQQLNAELTEGWLFWRATYDDFRTRMREIVGNMDAGVYSERAFCEMASAIFQDTPEVAQ